MWLASLVFTLAKIPGLGGLQYIKYYMPLSEALLYQHCAWRDADVWTVPYAPKVAPHAAVSQMLKNWRQEVESEL